MRGLETSVQRVAEAERKSMSAALAHLERASTCERCGHGRPALVEVRSEGDTVRRVAVCQRCASGPALRSGGRAPAGSARGSMGPTYFREALLADDAAAAARDDARAAARPVRRRPVLRRRLTAWETAKLADQVASEASRIAAEDLGLARRRR